MSYPYRNHTSQQSKNHKSRRDDKKNCNHVGLVSAAILDVHQLLLPIMSIDSIDDSKIAHYYNKNGNERIQTVHNPRMNILRVLKKKCFIIQPAYLYTRVVY